MLEALARVEIELPELLDDPGWRSLRIDYHPPQVDRLWRPWGALRVALHRIHPCPPGSPLFHPPPWPSAMHVVSGTYEMGIGYGVGAEAPPVAARLILDASPSPGQRYEMTHPDAWHYVRPIGGFVYSVMVTGSPWERSAPRSDQPLTPLDDVTRDAVLTFFRGLYPRG